MRRQGILTILLLLASLPLWAAHIAGGELYYSYLGVSTTGLHRYKVTLRLFRECTSNGPRLESEVVNIGAYHANTLGLAATLNLQKQGELQVIRLNASAIPCISGDTNVCYQVQYYGAELQLPASANGYVLAWNRCCRANGIANVANSNDASATYTANIPWNYPSNNSPVFRVKDTALVCAGRNFVLDFGAVDEDGDSLSYAFTPAYGGPNSQGQTPAAVLNLPPLNYTNVYTGAQPLGNQVKINAVTGVISGLAPSVVGRLVVNVTISEWRNGQQISTHRKDFMIKVGDCDFVDAKIDPIVNCDNYTVQFENQSTSSGVQRYEWNFGDLGSVADTSLLAQPQYQYPDTGVFVASLTAFGAAGCKATDTTLVRIFPGFQAGFGISTLCYKSPIRFSDSTKAVYGQVNGWFWDFGDAGTQADTSRLQNPSYQYLQPAEVQVRLIAASTKGCRDTLVRLVTISNEPGIQLPPELPLCRGDSVRLPLVVEGNPASYSWTPATYMSNPAEAQPLVWPPQQQSYTVVVGQDGCTGQRTVKVRLVDTISINLNRLPDLCGGDTVLLQATGDGNEYRWQPPTYLENPNAARTRLWPDTIITYTVSARLGSCTTSTTTTVKAYPAPLAFAGPDTALCMGGQLRLQGKVRGDRFFWMPNDGSLSNTTLLQPMARPQKRTTYVLVVTGNEGCRKTVQDTVVVRVNALPKVFAGNDTNVVMGRPLQLNASGASQYQWLPNIYFNDASKPNPRIQLPVGITPVMLVVKGLTDQGCEAFDTMLVKQFDGLPEIYVPTAFTPNADGRNDVLRAIPAGVQFRSFRVFDRLGVMVFATANASQGWNGFFRGVAQPSGTYVFIAEGVDGEGAPVVRKGTSVLIR